MTRQNRNQESRSDILHVHLEPYDIAFNAKSDSRLADAHVYSTIAPHNHYYSLHRTSEFHHYAVLLPLTFRDLQA